MEREMLKTWVLTGIYMMKRSGGSASLENLHRFLNHLDSSLSGVDREAYSLDMVRELVRELVKEGAVQIRGDWPNFIDSEVASTLHSPLETWLFRLSREEPHLYNILSSLACVAGWRRLVGGMSR